MKNVKFLIAIFAAAIFIASCATTQPTSDEYDETNTSRRVGDRVYVEDPFYGTVVLERDPFTGRYYDISAGYRGLSSPYNSWNTYRRYGDNNRYYRQNNSRNVQQPPREQIQQNREETRKKILGSSN